MLTFAAIAPHPPLLIPNIGKENIGKLDKTKEALGDLEKKFDLAGVETLIIIASHHKMHYEAFSILFNKKYQTDFKEFGDLETTNEFLPDMELIEKIRHAAIDDGIPFALTHSRQLNYAYGVPLFYLAKDKKIKIIPFSYSYKDAKTHFEVGRLLKKVIMQSNKKIGIIASGNLSHKAGKESPLGYSPQGKEFDDKLVKLLETKNTAGILSIENKLAKEADECILSALSVLLGVIEKVNCKPQIFSYETPLGIGYLVCHFKLL